MTTTFHLVRHGTHGRLDHTLCGRMAGVSLSESGRAEARATAGRLQGEPVAALYSSPLERCRETSEVLSRALDLPVQDAPDLIEIDFGGWTGRRLDDLRGDPAWDAWNARRSLHRPPGGESMGEAQMRAVRCVEAMRAAYPDASVALVTHSDVIKALVMHWLGLPLDFYHRFEIGPASLTTAVAGDWGAKLIRLNEEPR